MKYPILFFLLILLFCNCRGKKAIKETSAAVKSSFTYFEMSFRGGWSGGFSLRVDSNKIFIAPSLWVQPDDSVKYGLMPDTIVRVIDSVLHRIQHDTAIKSNYNFCDDCDILSIKAITGGDSANLFQVGRISEPVYKLIDQLRSFLKSTRLSRVNAFMQLETAKDIAPPPPPKIEK